MSRDILTIVTCYSTLRLLDVALGPPDYLPWWYYCGLLMAAVIFFVLANEKAKDPTQ